MKKSEIHELKSKDIEENIKEVEELHQRIDRTLNDINLVIEIIKSQPAENDDWFLNRLYGFKVLLGDKGK